MRPAIRVENLGKSYRISHASQRGAYKTLRESMTDIATAPFRRLRNGGANGSSEEFWALEDVSFDVIPGEVVGIIGRNGAGKSTLLKILSRITKPTTGRVQINGRVGSLLEVGTGFHPELTGRENIYLNGSILGMGRGEIAKKFDEIVAFAEIEKFLDTPVKRYSSGMYVRLAFAVAAYLEPEILIVDEVLAVGDASFQRKCVRQMGEVSRQGRTVLLVSHDLPMVNKLSTRVVWLKDGALHESGRPGDVIEKYYAMASQGLAGTADVDLSAHPNRRAKSQRILERLRVMDRTGKLTTSIRAGDGLYLELSFKPDAIAFGHSVGLDLCDISGAPLGQWWTVTHSALNLSDVGSGRVICRVESLPLVPGDYALNVWAGDIDDYVEVISDVVRLTILPSDYFGTGKLPPRKSGPMLLSGAWSACDTATDGLRAVPVEI